MEIAIGTWPAQSEISVTSHCVRRQTTAACSRVPLRFQTKCGIDDDGDPILTTGESITVTYVDFRDETGGGNEWSDSATIGADTGSVSLDRTVYPVPTAAADIEATKVTITVSVDDSDEDTSSSSRRRLAREADQ